MSTHVLCVDIDPRDLRTFRHLDIVLDEITKRAIDRAACTKTPVRIALTLTVEDARVPA